MKQYAVRFDKTINLVLAMIIPPLLIVPVLVLLAFYVPGLPDWGVGTIIAVMILLIVFFTFNLVNKLSPKGVLILYNDRFVVEFSNKSMFTPASFEIKITDIINSYAGASKAGFYLRFVTSARPFRFNLSAGSRSEEDDLAFREFMLTLAGMIADKYKKEVPENQSI